jgi:H+-transporting ATPase
MNWVQIGTNWPAPLLARLHLLRIEDSPIRLHSGNRCRQGRRERRPDRSGVDEHRGTLVEQGRTIYQRILTWIVNKISRTILKAAFVAIAYVVTGKFVVSAFAMLLLVFMTDFAKISLATDNVRPSRKPETWNIGGYITVSVVVGVAMVAETLLLLWIGWSHFGLAADDSALYTFSFLMLLYFAVFSVVSARERIWFWATLPSKTFMSALAADAAVGSVMTFAGLPGLSHCPGGRCWRYLFVP